MGKIGKAAQRIAFTVAMTGISRTLMVRDRILGRLRRNSPVAAPGVSFSRHPIRSGNNILDAVLARPTDCPVQTAVLLCHGIGETVEHWFAVQQLLAAQGVASLVFDYSGYGRSSGFIGATQCERDAIAAFLFLQQFFPSCPISVLGFSLGSGIATAVVAKVAARMLIVCAAFTSLQEAALSAGLPGSLAFLVPDIWVTKQTLRSCPVPVLIVHGEKDRLFPVQMAANLRDNCSSQCEFVIVPGLSHNEPFYHPRSAYWALIISRLWTPPPSATPVPQTPGSPSTPSPSHLL